MASRYPYMGAWEEIIFVSKFKYVNPGNPVASPIHMLLTSKDKRKEMAEKSGPFEL